LDKIARRISDRSMLALIRKFLVTFKSYGMDESQL
jgi:hypothetical protein